MMKLVINRHSGIIADEIALIDRLSESCFDNMIERRQMKIKAIESRIYKLISELSTSEFEPVEDETKNHVDGRRI